MVSSVAWNNENNQYRICRVWETSHDELRINFALATYTYSLSGVQEGHILLSRPLPWGCSPRPMGSCTTLQGATFKWHGNALEDGSGISRLLTLCQQAQHTKNLRPGASPKFLSLLPFSLNDHIPSEGLHSSCSCLLFHKLFPSSLPSVAPVTLCALSDHLNRAACTQPPTTVSLLCLSTEQGNYVILKCLIVRAPTRTPKFEF